jgi:hypothetical protein
MPYIEITMDTFGIDHPCWHKIEAYYTNGTAVESAHTNFWFYLDPDPPTTLNWTDGCWNMTTMELCLNYDSIVLLNASDGLWNIEDASCPTGVCATWYNITHIASGNYTGWTLYDGMVNLSLLEEDCEHEMVYYSADCFGNVEAFNYMYFFFDNTPPTVTSDIFAQVSIDCDCCCGNVFEDEVGVFTEFIPDPENASREIEVYKQVPDGWFNITAFAAETGCCTNNSFELVLKVYGPNYDSSINPPVEYWELNMNALGGGNFYYNFTDTASLGLYTFVIEASDCLGNTNTSIEYGLVKYLCDIDIIELVTPDPGKWHPFLPTEVEAIIKNNGILDCPGPINVHLQIYEEAPFDLDDWYCSDENCILNTWETYSYDGDPVTWAWTEKRSYTPTHSWHCVPDYLDYYEAYSNDSLILTNHSTNGLLIPDYINIDDDLQKVYLAYLNFSQWCEGEEYFDYGTVYIWNRSDPGDPWVRTQLNADPIWDTDGEWEVMNDTADDNADEQGFDISEYIGQYVKIEFNWQSDALVNREGWYIDDLCIRLQYGARQPLVYQQYKYVFDLDQNAEQLVEFPLDFEPKNDTWYFFEVYSDACSDADGPRDENYDTVIDPRTEFEYKDPWNGVNESIYFGDVCDAAITDIALGVSTPIEMPDTGIAEIPIDVTVQNTGTLTKDVPVQLRIEEKVIDTMYFDDMEELTSPGYVNGTFGSAPAPAQTDTYPYASLWHLDDYGFYSPYQAWCMFDDETYHYDAGRDEYLVLGYDVRDSNFVEQNVDWGAIEFDENFDITCQMKWNLAPGEDQIYAVLGFRGNIVSLSSSGHRDPDHASGAYPDAQDWTEVSMTDYIDMYFGSRGETLGEFAHWLVEYFGGTWPDDFYGYGFIVFGSAYGIDTVGLPDGAWSGVMIDDVKMQTSYAGDVVYTDTIIVEDLEQLESEDIRFWWNTTSYCDYIATAEVMLDCDQNDSNNNMSTELRIYEQLYTDLEDFTLDDNTCGLPDHWHLVEECSACPEDWFWFNGDVEDDDYGYASEMNDCLYIDQTFNLTVNATTNFTIAFDTYYGIEDGSDFGYLQISNDSGLTWFTIDTYTGNNSGWETLSYALDILAVTPPKLYSEYTDFEFDMPSSFFTDSMQVRFKFVTDNGNPTYYRGWFIDDVMLEGYNGTWTTFFYDTMQDAVSTNENWTHMECCAGSHWHNETVFGDSPYSTLWYWNGENRTWPVAGATLVNATYDWSTPLPAYWTFTNNAPAGVPLIDSGAGYVDIYHVSAPDADVYLTQHDVELPVSPNIYLDYMAWRGDTTGYHWIEVTDGITTEYTQVYIPDLTDTPITVDMSTFSGKTVDISFHYNGSYSAPNDWWGTGLTIMELWDHWEIWSILPGLAVPYGEYYNMVDEKIIFEMDLTKAYEAILSWGQNYSFADVYDDDYGVVEIWDNGDWKALFIVQGTSGGWGDLMLDLSDYVGGDENTLIRFRFISNETFVDYGWLIDYISVEGKLDTVPPEATGALDPNDPTGCHDWYDQPVTVKLTATDNVAMGTIYYSIDGGAWLTYTAPISIGIDGIHTVEYYPVDSVGNEGDHDTLTFKVDTTNPTGSITMPQAGYIYFMGRELMPRILVQDKAMIIGPLNAAASASDATSGVDYVTFTTGAGSVEDAVAPYGYPLPFSMFGSDTLTVSVTDEACNSANIGSVDYFKIF